MLAAGAELCVGVDRDKDIVARNNSRRMRQHATNRARIQFVNDTIPSFISNDAEDYPLFDYFICFSVLPYLDSPGGFLYAVTGIADRGLLEVQYLDDGPGTVDRTGLDKVLELFWTTREVIGSTPVDYRNVERDIWLLSP